jgi:prolipoprotein diacylglyceryltransferase
LIPVVSEVGPVSITSFGVMVALGFLGAGWLLAAELRRRGRPSQVAWDLVLLAAAAGIVGFEVYYLARHWQETVADPLGMLSSRAGLLWYDGFIAAALAVQAISLALIVAAVLLLVRLRGRWMARMSQLTTEPEVMATPNASTPC